MGRRTLSLVGLVLPLAGCGGRQRYGTGNPISGYSDCDILQAGGSTICDDARRTSVPSVKD